MKNLLKLSTFIMLLCSFVFSTTSIVIADEKKAEDATAMDAEKNKGDEAKKDEKADDKDKKKKSKDEEEPECE